MTQPATRDAEVPAPTGVVTVADLLSRYGPVSAESEPATGPVSVASLLRREGTGPFAAVAPGVEDDELEVTEYHGEHVEDAEYDPRYEHEDDEPRWRRPSGIAVKRTAIAAGVLLAAGSVVGATVATAPQAPPAPTSGDQALAETPGRSWLDPAASVPAPTVAPTVPADALDAGEPVDRSWMQAAFPAAADTAEDDDAPDDGDAPATAEREAPVDTEDAASTPAPDPTGTGGSADEDTATAPESGAGTDDDSDAVGDDGADGTDGTDGGGAGDGSGDESGDESGAGDGAGDDDGTAGRGDDRGDQDAGAGSGSADGTDGAGAVEDSDGAEQ